MSSDEGGLRRWAHRKAQVKRQRGSAVPVLDREPAEAPSLNEPPDAAAPAEASPAETPSEGLDLPDIESLTAESDFSAFMKKGVPPTLRSLALRKLWSSDPMFNIIDEMVEYGEDYTNAAMIVEGMKSAWEPDRGYARDDGQSEESAGSKAESDMPDETDAGTADGAEIADGGAEGCADFDGEEPDEDPDLG